MPFAQLNYKYPGTCESYDKWFRILFFTSIGIGRYRLQFRLYKEADCSGIPSIVFNASSSTNQLDQPLDDTFTEGGCYNESTTPFPTPFQVEANTRYPITYRFHLWTGGEIPPWQVFGYSQFQFDNASSCSRLKAPSQGSYRQAYSWRGDNDCITWGDNSITYTCSGEGTDQVVMRTYEGNSYCCSDVSEEDQTTCPFKEETNKAPQLSSKGSTCISSSPTYLKDTCIYPRNVSISRPTPFKYAKLSYYASQFCCYSQTDIKNGKGIAANLASGSSTPIDSHFVRVADCDKQGSVAPFFEEVQNLDECLINYDSNGAPVSSYRMLYTPDPDVATTGVYAFQHQLYPSIDCSGPLGQLKSFDGYSYSNITCNGGNDVLFQHFQLQLPGNSFRLQLFTAPPSLVSGYTMAYSSTPTKCSSNQVAFSQAYRHGSCVPDYRGFSYAYTCSIGGFIVQKLYPGSLNCCGGSKRGCGVQTKYSNSYDCSEILQGNANYVNQSSSYSIFYKSLTCNAELSSSLAEYAATQLGEWRLSLAVAAISILASLVTISVIIRLRKFNEYNLILFALMIAQVLYDATYFLPFSLRIKRLLTVYTGENSVVPALDFLQIWFGLLVSLISNVLASTICYTVFYSRSANLRRYLAPLLIVLLLVSVGPAAAQLSFNLAAKAMEGEQAETTVDQAETNSRYFDAQKAGLAMLMFSILLNAILVAAVFLKVLAIHSSQRRGRNHEKYEHRDQPASDAGRDRPTSNAASGADLPSSPSRFSSALFPSHASIKKDQDQAESASSRTRAWALGGKKSSPAHAKGNLLSELAGRLVWYPVLSVLTQLPRVIDRFTVEMTDDDAVYQTKANFALMWIHGLFVPSGGLWFAVVYIRHSPGAWKLLRRVVVGQIWHKLIWGVESGSNYNPGDSSKTDPAAGSSGSSSSSMKFGSFAMFSLFSGKNSNKAPTGTEDGGGLHVDPEAKAGAPASNVAESEGQLVPAEETENKGNLAAVEDEDLLVLIAQHEQEQEPGKQEAAATMTGQSSVTMAGWVARRISASLGRQLQRPSVARAGSDAGDAAISFQDLHPPPSHHLRASSSQGSPQPLSLSLAHSHSPARDSLGAAIEDYIPHTVSPMFALGGFRHSMPEVVSLPDPGADVDVDGAARASLGSSGVPAAGATTGSEARLSAVGEGLRPSSDFGESYSGFSGGFSAGESLGASGGVGFPSLSEHAAAALAAAQNDPPTVLDPRRLQLAGTFYRGGKAGTEASVLALGQNRRPPGSRGKDP